MALQRDFETPVASFDLDQSPWESACPVLLLVNHRANDTPSVIYKFVAV